MSNEFIPTAETLKEMLASNIEAIKARDGVELNDDAYAKYVSNIFIHRVQNNPASYLEFGLYWDAVKRIFINLGFDGFGVNVDESMADTFYQGSDALTLIAADMFVSNHRQNYLQGNRSYNFSLNGEDVSFSLFDDSMEMLLT